MFNFYAAPVPTQYQRIDAACKRVREALPTLLADVVVDEIRFLTGTSWSPNTERLDRLIAEINQLPVPSERREAS